MTTGEDICHYTIQGSTKKGVSWEKQGGGGGQTDI
jgi:hypothetical protein